MAENLNQLKTFWSELSGGQKATLILAFAGVLVGFLVLSLWSGQPQMQLLYGNLAQDDMADVVAKLEELEAPYEIRGGGNSIFVNRAEVYRLRMQLAQEGIPAGGNVGFEIFDRSNFGISDFVQRTNYLRAVQGELSRTVAQLNGVQSARVMVVMPENRLLVTNDDARATASVFIDTGNTVLPSQAVNSIRFLVANAVEGVRAEDVAVVDQQGNTLSEELTQSDVVGMASSQFKLRQSLESYFIDRIETMLAPIVGNGNVVARVSVEIDHDAVTRVEEVFDPESQVARTQTTSEDNTTSTETRRQDAVGVVSNTPEMGGLDGNGNGTSSESSERSKNRTTTYEINRTTSEIVRNPGSIRQVSAAVFINTRFAGVGPERQAQPRTTEELERLRVMVANALGVANGNGAAPELVTLQETPFEGQMETVQGGFGAIEDRLFRYSDLLRNLIAVGIAIVMFVLFLRLVKRHKPESFTFEVLEEEEDDLYRKEMSGDVSPRLTPELLNELIREKPENVSTALRSWAIGTKREE